MEFKTDIELCNNSIYNAREVYGYLQGIAKQVQGVLSVKYNKNGFTQTDYYNGLQNVDLDFTRIQGAAGIQGARGERGPAGAQGPSGYGGAQGAQGLQGIQGYYGIQGIQGYPGAQGLQGAQGFNGVGVQGHQGTTGIQGAQGSVGAQGLSEVDALTWHKIRQLFAANGILLGRGYIACTNDNNAQGIVMDQYSTYDVNVNLNELHGLIPPNYNGGDPY